MPETFTCGRCESRWPGAAVCHCGSCHQTFSGITLFDAHRHQHGDRGGCADPATILISKGPHVGEPLMQLRNGRWSYPEMTDAQKLARFGTAS